MKWVGIAIASLFMVSPVFACGIHGTNAGNDINDWLEGNAQSSENVTTGNTNGQFGDGVDQNGSGVQGTNWADGGQSSYDDNGNAVAFHWEGGDDGDVEVGEGPGAEGSNAGTGMGNENYWVNITLPNSNTVTINTSSESWDRTDGGGAIETWLFEQGLEVIRNWFENYEPEDLEDQTYVG